jgi:cation:H+ antiporter
LFIFISTRSKNDETPLNHTSSKISLNRSLIYFVIGAALLPLGGYLTVTGAVSLASGFGISELIISIFAVAIGTSLPELATCLIAANRKKPGLIIGNILGSNIFNILFVLGIVGLVNDVSFNPSLNYEICVIILASILFWALAMMTPRFKLIQWQGLVLLGCYVIYCYQLFF